MGTDLHQRGGWLLTSIFILAPIIAAGDDNTGSSPSAANPTDKVEEKSLAFKYQYLLQTFAAVNDIPYQSSFNPNNSLANFPNYEQSSLIRSKFSVGYGNWIGKISPYVGYVVSSHSDQSDKVNGIDYFQDWNAEYRADTFSLSYSRELLYWGPSIFASPSNLFFANSNQTNPFIPPGAGDFIQFRYFPNYSDTISIIANIARGREDIYWYPQFTKGFAIKADHRGDEFALSGVIAYRDSEDLPQFGSYGQWTASDSMLFYYDAGISFKGYGLYPIASNNPIGYEFAPEGNGHRVFGEALVGGSYTTSRGDVLNLEYRYYSQGYTNSESSAYYQMASNAAAMLSDPDAGSKALAMQTLGQASQVYLRTLNQHYIYASIRTREIVKDLSLYLLMSFNVQDGSAQLVPIMEYNLFGRVNLATDFVFNLGGPDTEYGRYINSTIFVGLKYYSD